MGKVGRANRFAREKIAEISEENGLDYCEVQISPACYGEAHAPAHRHERVWYRKSPDLLWDIRQWLACCTNCHTALDDRSLTTEEESEAIFLRIRGPE